MPGELEPLRSAYLVVGNETWFRDRFRERLLEHAPPEGRDYSVFEEDLRTTPLEAILDRARTPSLMAPLQIFFIRGVKELFSRAGGKAEGEADAKASEARKGGKRKHGDFPENLRQFLARQAPGTVSAVLVFIADHIEIPADRNRMGLEDKARLQRLEEVFAPIAAVVACARVPVAQAAQIAAGQAAALGAELAPDLAQLVAESLDGDLGLIAREVEKLALAGWPERPIPRAAVEQLSLGSRKASAFELIRTLARRNRAQCLTCLRRIWAAEGDAEAIPLVFQLGRAFKMALVTRQAQARDVRGMYGALPEGLRPPGFAAEAILALSRLPEPLLWKGVTLWQRVDVELRSSPLSMKLLFEDAIFQLTANS